MSQENAHNYLKEKWNFVKIGMETQNRYKLKVRKSYVAYQYRFLDILESSGGGAKLSHPERNRVKAVNFHPKEIHLKYWKKSWILFLY